MACALSCTRLPTAENTLQATSPSSTTHPLSSPAGADNAAPSSRRGLPSWARSVRIVRGDEPLFARPGKNTRRRGAARIGALLPVYAAQYDEGCADAWFHVGPEAWVCGEGTELSNAPGAAPNHGYEALADHDGLPYRYYFVGELGALGYRDLATAEQGAPDLELEPGFAIAVARTARDTDPFGLTPHGFWVPMRDLHPARPSSFRGAQFPANTDVESSTAKLAWTVRDGTPVHRTKSGPVIERLPKQVRLNVVERNEQRGKAWLRIGPDRWVREDHVARPMGGEPPSGLLPFERWIDVDLGQQVLTAYEGEKPVFSTLVSTGRGSGPAENATPIGEHRIWVKLVASDMSNLEATDVSRYYSMQSVPWVMYFKKGYGLHGAYWHGDFGQRRSHGCINLSPPDAARLFQWTEPRLPAGWTAILPGRYERGTLIRVRNSSG